MAALIQGNYLTDTATGCVLLKTPSGRFPVVWPKGTHFDADSKSILLPGNRRIREGQRVRGGGGYIVIDGLERVVGIDLKIPADCLSSTREVAVFNPDAAVDVVRSP